MLMCGSASAFAQNPAPRPDSYYLQASIQTHCELAETTFEVVAYEVVEDGDFVVCSMLVEPQGYAELQRPEEGELYGRYALDCWFKDGNLVGDIYAIANFEYNGSSAIVLDYWHVSGNMKTGATYTVSKQSYSNSGLLNSAYYKITYSFNYANTSKTRTLEVNCSKTGVVGGNGTLMYL